MKPWISLPTLLTYMLSSRDCSHGDVLEQNLHWSTGRRNWAITLRHLNTCHYFPHKHVVTTHTIDRNINCDTPGGLFAHSLNHFSLKILHGSCYSVRSLFTIRYPARPPPWTRPPPPADLGGAVSCFLQSGSGSSKLFTDRLDMSDWKHVIISNNVRRLQRF